MVTRGSNGGVERARAVVRLVMRDVASPLAGFSMLGYETVFEQGDRPWIILAALTLLGYPVADRIDRLLKGQEGGNGNGKARKGAGGNGGNNDEDDPYAGPDGYYRAK